MCKYDQDLPKIANMKWRQRLGPRLVEESNEIIRIISGLLVRELTLADVPINTLFPNNYHSRLYEGFPLANQDQRGWIFLFDAYVDQNYVAPKRHGRLVTDAVLLLLVNPTLARMCCIT